MRGPSCFPPMKEKDKNFLRSLLQASAPSGLEAPVQQLVADYVRSCPAGLVADLHGNLIASRSPEAPFRIMLAAHADQVGFMIRYIDPDGFAFIQFVGGTDKKVMHGSHVIVLGRKRSHTGCRRKEGDPS
jgi:putative aminopeptidase FrvX